MPDLTPFSEVYEAFGPRVHRFCLSRLRDRAAAEDITADVFVSAFRAYERVRPPADEVQIWLFRIARNAIIDHLRRQSRWRGVWGRLRSGAGESTTVEADAEIRADLRQALAAMNTLRGRDRDLVGLRVAAGLSYPEIGRILGISTNAATVATFRALERIRRASVESE